VPRWVGFFRFHGLLGDADRPPAVVLRDGEVWDANRAARALGIHPGQAAAAARTVCPEASWRPFDPAAMSGRLTAAWDLLAAAAAQVEPDPDGRPEAYAAWPDGAPPREEVRWLAAAVRDALPHVDLAAGLADGRLLARAACPPGPGVGWVEGPRARQRLLAALPLADLAAQGLLSPQLLRRLRDMGLFVCGQVADVPERALLARFGQDGPRLRGLCLGRDPRPVRALYPPRTLDARRAFPDGLPPEGWAAAAAALARRAAARLQAGEGARTLRVRVDEMERSRVWKAPRGTPDVLVRAAAALAEGLARGCRGPAGALAVALGDLAGLSVRPLDLLARERPDAEALEGLLERLPRQVLRRGWGRDGATPADRHPWLRRHEALLALLDPWRASP
jgi:nucleotidyltransferase/DNA polymerase involved in DNA repair